MNKKLVRYCLYGYCSLSAYVSCMAQGSVSSDQIQPPQPPFINKLPNFARYEMVLDPGTQGRVADPKAPPHVSKIDVTKTDNIKLISSMFNNGEARAIWAYKGFILFEQSKPKAVLIYRAGIIPLELPVGPDDFVDLGWLSASSYKNVVTFEGKKCYLFETGGGGGNRRAFVDVTTKLPEMASNGTKVWRYSYDPAPTAVLQLPPAFAKVWAENEPGINALSGKSGPR